MRTAGIVLCGGRSSRMGAPKAWLPVGGEALLARVVRVVGEAAGPVVVVAAPGQDVPPLPPGVRIVRDEAEGRGPLGGLAAGLAALAGEADAVYLSSCDVPLLKPAFVRRVVEALDPTPRPPPLSGEGEKGGSLFSPSPLRGGGRGVGFSAAVPRAGGRLHPLAAAYRLDVLPVVRERLAANQLRMLDLFDAIPTRMIEADELTAADPHLLSLRNVNTPDEYADVLREVE